MNSDVLIEAVQTEPSWTAIVWIGGDRDSSPDHYAGGRTRLAAVNNALAWVAEREAATGDEA